jgi:rhodanese-related sulfurtransferase
VPRTASTLWPRLIVGASLGLAMFTQSGPVVADEPLLPQAPLAADTVVAFLAAHTGPVLHVSFDSDCALSLARTTHRIPIDDAFTDAEIRYEAEELFVAEVKATAAMAEALQRQARVLVVCCAGVRSTAAASALARHGFRVVTIAGGTSNPKLPQHLVRAP